jgi:outer membrane protein assembly factor BamB
MVIVKGLLYFNNSIGDISAVDINKGQLIWQLPTQSNLIYEAAFTLKTSDIVADPYTLFFSNNKNKFFSLDMESGYINWQQKINSSLKPTLVGDYLFTVSENGYLFVIEKQTGNIIRINDIFGEFNNKLRKKIYPTGFIVGMNSIYLTTSHGRLLVVDTTSGKNQSILKIDKNKISRPSILNQDMFIVTDNSIIRLN